MNIGANPMPTKPFHESIVDQINDLPTSSEADHGLYVIANLITRTVIPRNHDAIKEALTQKRERIRPYIGPKNGVFEAVEKAISNIESERKRHIKEELHPYREGAMF